VPRAAAPLTRQAEDYLKAIHALERAGAAAGTSDIAGRLGIAAASVSGMLRRLARLGLVSVERYKGARLTPAGRAEALLLIRRDFPYRGSTEMFHVGLSEYAHPHVQIGVHLLVKNFIGIRNIYSRKCGHTPFQRR